MSKVNAMQAMREARYAAAKAAAQVKAAGLPPQAGAPAKRPTAGPAVSLGQPPAVAASSPVAAEMPDPVASPAAAPAPALLDGAPEPVEALCGHRSMNNRLCRRPAGHPEKNHRYG